MLILVQRAIEVFIVWLRRANRYVVGECVLGRVYVWDLASAQFGVGVAS